VGNFAFLMPLGKPQQHQTLPQHELAEALPALQTGNQTRL